MLDHFWQYRFSLSWFCLILILNTESILQSPYSNVYRLQTVNMSTRITIVHEQV